MSLKIALAGNPNCGKTTLFNALTGSNQFVGNWPGVTVEKKEGKLKKHDDVVITDLPGIYSLSPYTLEEVVARNYLIGQRPDAILNIIDGTNLERNLYLTTQLTELGIPVVVAVNMMDLVRKNGDVIKTDALAEELGCKVVEISALKGTGIMEAAEAAITAAVEGTELRASCTVRCKLPEDQPVSGGGNSSSQGSGNGGSSSQAPAADQVDLSAFYTQLSGDYEFPSFMQQADQELMDIFYPGLSAVSSQQMLVYVNQMSMNMGELALIEVTDSKDVDGVKAILQARIDGMINGGAWYPEPTRIWTECSRVVSNGNYILMVVHEQCDAIVDDFNALF